MSNDDFWTAEEREALRDVPGLTAEEDDAVLDALAPFMAARERQASAGCCACHGPAAAARDDLAETLRLRSEALNRVAAENEALRARLAKVEALCDAPPLLMSGIERDLEREPRRRGGEVRYYPAHPGVGSSGCPGDNLTDWLDQLREALS